MKKVLCLALSFIVLSCALCSCGRNDADESGQSVPVSISESSDITSEITEGSAESTESKASPEISFNATVSDLGVPLGDKYSYADISIVPWDIALFGGKLFVGSGDLSMNSGPVQMWCYDTSADEWQLSATLPEEEISRFYIYDGALYCPGADSQESWDYASFYKYDGEWEKYRSIPNASHCFDLAFADGMIFAAMENEADTVYWYVAVSSNGGKSFSIVPLTRDGEKVKRTVFLQDVFAIGGDVYALASESNAFNLYKYDGEKFEYSCSWKGRITLHGIRKYILQSKAEHNGALYFTTGSLYKCESNMEPELISMPQSGIVQDIYLNDGELNIMCVSYNGNAYVMTVYRFDDEEKATFEKICEFEYETTALCFAAKGNSFYFGIGTNRADKNNGRIIHVETGN